VFENVYGSRCAEVLNMYKLGLCNNTTVPGENALYTICKKQEGPCLENNDYWLFQLNVIKVFC